MASEYQNIRKALEAHLAAITGLPEVSWENVEFSPTTGTSFVRPQFLPTLREPAVRGPNPQQLYRGLYTVLCYAPENEGPKVTEDIADLIIDAFEATTDISGSGVIVSIRNVDREPGISLSPWHYIPVNVNWYTYL